MTKKKKQGLLEQLFNLPNKPSIKFLVTVSTFLAATLSLITIAVNVIDTDVLDNDWFFKANVFLHLIVIVFFFFWWPERSFQEATKINSESDLKNYFVVKDINLDSQLPKAIESVKLFLNFWTALCFIWGSYYLVLSTNVFFKTGTFSASILLDRFIFNSLNSAETIVIMGCFYLFTTPLYNDNTNKVRLPRGFYVLTAGFVLWTFYDSLVKYSQSTGIGSSHSFDFFVMLPDFIGGIISCTFFSLLTGRLDSKFLGYNSILIALLYFYAGVQAAFPFFNYICLELEKLDKEVMDHYPILNFFVSLKMATYYIALMGKIILFYMMFIGVQKRRFLYYFLNIIRFDEIAKGGRDKISIKSTDSNND